MAMLMQYHMAVVLMLAARQVSRFKARNAGAGAKTSVGC